MKKLFWFLFNNRGEVDNSGAEGNDAGSIQDALMEGFESEETPPETPPADGDSEKVHPQTDMPIKTGDYSGADRRAKAYEGERRREADKANEDPEFEMPFEIEQGKGKHKFKKSDLIEIAKWAHENRNDLAGWRNLRMAIGKNENFGKLFNGVLSKAMKQDGSFDDEFIGRQLSSLEKKAEATDQKITDKDDQIKQIEELLNSDEIDPDSVQARVLKGNLEALKQARGQLQETLGKITELEKKFGSVETNTKNFLKSQEDADSAREIKRLSDMFGKSFKESTAEYKFIDDEERADYESKVRDVVAKSVTDSMNDESYVKLIRDTSKAVYERASKLREAHVNDYIKQKGLKAPEGEEGDDAVKELDGMKAQLAELEKSGKGESEQAVALRDKIKQAQEFIDDPLKGKSMGETLAEMF